MQCGESFKNNKNKSYAWGLKVIDFFINGTYVVVIYKERSYGE